MTGKRWYDDACGMALGLNLVGDRWALHVVRELLLGPKRFADLRGDLPGISSNVLAQRLDELEERVIVRRRRLPPPASAWVYELTEWGAELEPVIVHLGRWAVRSPAFGRESRLSCTSVVLSMRTMFRPEAAAGLDLRVGFRLEELQVLGRITEGSLDVGPVDALAAPEHGGPAAVVTTTPEVLAGILYDGVALDEALESGAATLEGDRAALVRYAECFWLPEPAAPTADDPAER
ncbi:winged helix-turn-helix transcriptional regulator [Georgenia halophila]|uniref:Winged helix-turn-helix transcriptional regulator n=1 Tax=Georgenia halophila TaxID=620889 RepID=A0ABP8LIE4_9MICO